MTLKEQISKDYITAMKERNTVSKNLLSVVKGEIQNVEKNSKVENLSDEGVMKILTKISKSLKETISLNNDKMSTDELLIIEKYLPSLMSREEISIKVTELVNSGVTQMGALMKEFATLNADKKVVSDVFKELVAVK